MNTMKAIVKKSAGPDDFGMMEVPIPQISETEILIQIEAIGVGIHDSYFLPQNIRYPYPIGIEGAGIIVNKGRRVSRFKEGDRVAFVSSMQPKGGTWAEFAAVDESSLILPIPDAMSFEEAAAIPVAGNTTLKALYALDLKPGDTLFIAGASGAIGTFAIQLAVAMGCTVAASASARNHEYMRSLGAVKTVDYHDDDWTEQIRQWMPGGVDAVMAIQPGTGSESLPVLKSGGRIVPVSGDQLPTNSGYSVRQLAYHVDMSDELIRMMNKIVSKEFKLTIEDIYPFTAGLDALRKTSTRRARGKLVITAP